MSKAKYRHGIGYDVHVVVPERKLMLGCVHFDDVDFGLEGHSDADVVAHAICDALLGAVAKGDIGEHFPPGQPRWKDAAGETLLKAVARMVHDDGYRIGNIDCVVICDVVRIGERKKQMCGAIAEAVGVGAGCVNVKATTCEGHGSVGRGEIIACEAIASIEKR